MSRAMHDKTEISIVRLGGLMKEPMARFSDWSPVLQIRIMLQLDH